jgi:hypothetical protein
VTDERKTRVAKNEALFRSLNEQVKEVAEPFLEVSARSETQPIGFVCECGREDCYETIELPLDEYERARAQPDRFVILPGHETPAVERVVSRGDRFWIVEKHAEASRVATAHDPRR